MSKLMMKKLKLENKKKKEEHTAKDATRKNMKEMERIQLKGT